MTRTIHLRRLLHPGDVCHFAEVGFEHGEGSGTHGHDFVELFWVRRGVCAETTAGGTTRWPAGTLRFIRRSDVHGVAGAPAGVIANLAFTSTHEAMLRRTYPGLLGGGFAEGTTHRLGTRELSAVEEAAAAWRTPGERKRDRLTLDRFLLVLDGILASRPREPHTSPPGWMADAVATLKADPRRLQGGTAALAATCGKRPEHVSRTFRQVYGQSPTQWINSRRLDRAAELLATTRRQVLDVCLASGFHNVGHFHSCFRSRFGTTPLRYRRLHQATLR